MSPCESFAAAIAISRSFAAFEVFSTTSSVPAMYQSSPSQVSMVTMSSFLISFVSLSPGNCTSIRPKGATGLVMRPHHHPPPCKHSTTSPTDLFDCCRAFLKSMRYGFKGRTLGNASRSSSARLDLYCFFLERLNRPVFFLLDNCAMRITETGSIFFLVNFLRRNFQSCERTSSSVTHSSNLWLLTSLSNSSYRTRMRSPATAMTMPEYQLPRIGCSMPYTSTSAPIFEVNKPPLATWNSPASIKTSRVSNSLRMTFVLSVSSTKNCKSSIFSYTDAP